MYVDTELPLVCDIKFSNRFMPMMLTLSCLQDCHNSGQAAVFGYLLADLHNISARGIDW